ncbi:MAG: DHH family phosphoesterase [Ruminococcus sp.]|nr:DHH family phosphoesterase [Ruminococcus sp.]
MKKKHWTTLPWFFIFGVVMFFMAMASFSYNKILSYIELGITVVSLGLIFISTIRFRSYVYNIVKKAVKNIVGTEPESIDKYKFPTALIGSEGDIIWCNMYFRKMLSGSRNPVGDSIYEYLNGYNINEIADGDGMDIAVDGREYTAYAMPVGDGYLCHLIENTYYKSMVREYNASLPCVAIITFDNAEVFLNDADEIYSQSLLAVESELLKWAAEYSALYKKVGNNRYMIIFRESDVEKMVELKFPVLKNIREIDTKNHIATISVGLCRGAKTLRESELDARKALEMALGRGGDQVALISNNSYEFFGGTSVASEKMSKVRMRVIANAIRRAVADCDKVYVMGHHFSDLDSVGAAIGMQCVMEKTFQRYCKIVIDKKTSMAPQLISYAEHRLKSDIFISVDDALKGFTPKSLLIIVDTHLRNSLESPELYDKSKKVIVIDHHRRAVNYINNALVFCHEPSASSASEMCSEIIGYLDDNAITYVQADALLAGIMLDTKNFVMRTGIRTFEAAAYLRRKGANTLVVKEMFSGSIDTYKEKVAIVCRTEIYKNCAISFSKNNDSSIRIAAAQAADEMLSLQGVNASFVIFSDNDRVNVSARSYGRVNVQLLMEKLGGGGHQTMAAVQFENLSIELVHKQLIKVIDELLEDASIT